MSHQLSAESCAATLNFGPSPKTLAAFQHRMNAFTRQALPFYGVRVPGTSNGDMTNPAAIAFDSDAMAEALQPQYLEYRRKIMELLATDPVFENKHMTGMTVKEQRELVLKQLQKVASCGLFRFRDLVDEPLKWITFMETLYFHGANIATKAGVHFGLFGNTIVSLGSEKMIKDLSDKIQSLEVRGAFALTELGHGSNARDIETTAHYDSAKQEFILHSPAETSQKMWIGNLGMHGNHAAVFAQLYVDNRHQGVHVFLVRIRDEKGNPVPGVRLLDCGTKMGLNGIDNGRMWLDHVRIPRENLLDRYGGVGVDGKYASPIASPTQRFTTMISALVGGRLVVAQGALHMSKVGLAIATRYALSRKQFGPPKEPEIVLLDYLGHQRRLFPLIAKTYALQFAMNHVKDLYAKHSAKSKELHILASGLKPAATWHRVKVLQECREACGGMGFHASNRIGALKTDADIDVTWEGDNHVLLHQVSASLIKELQSQLAANKGYEGVLAYFGRQMELEIRDKNIVKKFYSSEEHLTDYDFFRNALEYREARLLRALVNKTRKLTKKDPFEAWNQSNDLVEELAIASTERQILEHFIAGIKKEKSRLKPILHILCSLYALSVIVDHMGWFMTFRYFSPPKSKAIWNEINKLCGYLRPHARALVDAFDIPDKLIDAPIAEDYVKAFSYPNIPADFGVHSKSKL